MSKESLSVRTDWMEAMIEKYEDRILGDIHHSFSQLARNISDVGDRIDSVLSRNSPIVHRSMERNLRSKP
jgi:hypothetical protein